MIAPSLESSELEFNISNALDTPQVRDRLQRGVKLHDLANLKKFFDECRAEQVVRRTYGYLIQDMEFLQATGAMRFPERPLPLPVTTTRHWIAIKGFYKVDSVTLASESVEHRVIINTASVLAPILILDADAWRMYYLILKYSRGNLTKEQVFNYLIYILDVLRTTQLPFGHCVNDGFVKWVLYCKDYNDVRDAVCCLYEEGEINNIVGDTTDLLPKIASESFCMPSKSWIFSDGLYFQMALPSWTFSSFDGIDYTGNYIDTWDFFVVTD